MDPDAVGEKDKDGTGLALLEGVGENEAVLVGVLSLVGVWLMVRLFEGDILTLSAPVTVEWVATEAVRENVSVRRGLAVTEQVSVGDHVNEGSGESVAVTDSGLETE